MSDSRIAQLLNGISRVSVLQACLYLAESLRGVQETSWRDTGRAPIVDICTYVNDRCFFF